MKIAAILLALATMSTPAQNGKLSKADLLGQWIAQRKPPKQSTRVWKPFSRLLAKRIYLEAKRRSLDPIGLAAVAWVESDFRPWLRGQGQGRRKAEVGVWQLIPGDHHVELARKRLEGCHPGKMLPRWLKRNWLARMAGPRGPRMCEDQAVAALRRRVGSFSIVELRDTIISTYVAAYEMMGHIDATHKLKWWRSRKLPECRGLRPDFWRWGRYNSGPHPVRKYYVRRLCKRYRYISRALYRMRKTSNSALVQKTLDAK